VSPTPAGPAGPEKAGARILVVDDDDQLLRALGTTLTARGYRVHLAPDGETAMEAFAGQRPDLIVLDLGLPGIDGLAVIRHVQERASTLIVVLSARGEEPEKVRALDLGADDYLTKPFGLDELLARLRVALRHAAGPAAGDDVVFRAGDLEVDLERRRVTVRGQAVYLRPTEYELVKVFIAHPDRC
jgi:two-component system, OmpR family, KDP operon response regulator KdpE